MIATVNPNPQQYRFTGCGGILENKIFTQVHQENFNGYVWLLDWIYGHTTDL